MNSKLGRSFVCSKAFVAGLEAGPPLPRVFPFEIGRRPSLAARHRCRSDWQVHRRQLNFLLAGVYVPYSSDRYWHGTLLSRLTSYFQKAKFQVDLEREKTISGMLQKRDFSHNLSRFFSFEALPQKLGEVILCEVFQVIQHTDLKM